MDKVNFFVITLKSASFTVELQAPALKKDLNIIHLIALCRGQ
jgi:hypothetical protein